MFALRFLVPFLTLISTALAFNPFEQFFQQGGGGGGPQHHGPPPDAASDSSTYQMGYEGTVCSKYLCPATLACVHYSHHCPCAFPGVEDKVELGDGIAVCASKGGWKVGETQRKIELARKGLL